MNQIVEFMSKITNISFVDLIAAICIILLFRISSSTIAYIIVRMFRLEVKSKKKIKESAFYNPLRIFFNFLGVYLAILLIKGPFEISDYVMNIINKIFGIIGVLVFAKGFASSFLPKSTLVKKIKQRTNGNVEDSLFDFVLKIIRVVIYVIATFIIITILGVNLNGLVAGLGLRRINSNFSSSRYS